MFWPNSWRRTNWMNRGLRNRHINSEAVPAMRTRPETEPVEITPLVSTRPPYPLPRPVHGRLGLTPQRATHQLQPNSAGCLDQHRVPRPEQARNQLSGLARVGHRVRLAAEALGHR